ncbi:hypothetical protein, partial [Staphylococcus aureus]|uniref:hypothetical protein n=1 Tax=Staphylococcus aureus TaxID=1280 RepID=UPI0039BE41C0
MREDGRREIPLDAKDILMPRLHRWSAPFALAAAACLFAAVTLSAFAAQDGAPPPARTVDVVEQLFGHTVHDPYRWMEGDHNAEFQHWLVAQGQYTRGK